MLTARFLCLALIGMALASAHGRGSRGNGPGRGSRGNGPGHWFRGNHLGRGSRGKDLGRGSRGNDLESAVKDVESAKPAVKESTVEKVIRTCVTNAKTRDFLLSSDLNFLSQFSSDANLCMSEAKLGFLSREGDTLTCNTTFAKTWTGTVTEKKLCKGDAKADSEGDNDNDSKSGGCTKKRDKATFKLSSSGLEIEFKKSDERVCISEKLNAQLLSKIASLEASKTAVQNDLNARNGLLVTRTADFNSCEDEKTDLQSGLDTFNASLRSCQGEKTDLQSVLDTCQDEKTDLQSGLDTFNASLRSCQASKTALQNDLNARTADFNSCEGEKTDLESGLDTCNTSLGSCEDENTALQNDLVVCNGTLGTCSADLVSCQGEKTDLESGLATCNTSLGSCEGEKTDLESGLATCNTSLGSCEDENTALQNDLDACNGTLGTCSADLVSCQDDKTDLESGLATLITSLGSCQVPDVKTDLQSALDALKARLETCQVCKPPFCHVAGRCVYAYTDGNFNYADAKTFCKNQAPKNVTSTLFTWTTDAEFFEFAAFLKKTFPTVKYWSTAVTDAAKQGTWLLPDGSQVANTATVWSWDPNSWSTDDCAFIFSSGGVLGSESCASKNNPICQYIPV